MSRPTDSKKERTIQVRLDNELYKRLEYLKNVTGRNISDIVRDMIERNTK